MPGATIIGKWQTRKRKMICKTIRQLTDYACRRGLIPCEDRVYTINKLLEMFALNAYEEEMDTAGETRTLAELLDSAISYAAERGMIAPDSITEADLLDTKLMGLLTPPPSTVIKEFRERYTGSPEKATDYYYQFCRDTNYIRTDRVARDMKWAVASKYGDIDITINLSKPEKDPRAIAAAKNAAPSKYPKCVLCRETEGYAGHLNAAARQNHRIIPITLDNEPWYFQYSPYVYYNEHCIALSEEHRPMKIEESTFRKLLDFVSLFPHYFIGSNADLPIVGGSILSHDHMQGGRYTFAMAKASIAHEVCFPGYSGVEAGILKWPMSVLRLCSADRESLISLAVAVLNTWRSYSDPDAFIFAETDGEPHNTITPIARIRDGKYELDLVLRNNITTEEHPLGVFHPHAELHNIKRENIGLIEVMGLAVLPSRLKDEMERLAFAIVNKTSIEDDEIIAKHADWFHKFEAHYTFTRENVDKILQKEIGATFVRVLEDSGVYPYTGEGLANFGKFLNAVKKML